MATKLHSHLKHFIHEIILSEVAPDIGPSNVYEWKEIYVKELLERILQKTSNKVNTEELQRLVAQEIEISKEEFKTLLRLTETVLSQIPTDLLNR